MQGWGRGCGPMRIGHGGAPAVARANTLESFDAALEIGVDMIEFDVRPVHDELLLAHTPLDARRRRCPTLEEALDHVCTPRFAGVELNLDVKRPGGEAAILEALCERDLLERALISSMLPGVLDRVRELEPQARTAISIGRRLARRLQRWGEWRTRALEALEEQRFGALMLHHSLVDAELVEDARGAVYAWTVDDAALIARLCGLGVAGITTNDPRLFAATA